MASEILFLFLKGLIYISVFRCSKKRTEVAVVTQCSNVLLKLMAYPIDSVRQTCYTKIMDIVKVCQRWTLIFSL